MTNKKLQDIVRRLIEFLARPYQEGARWMQVEVAEVRSLLKQAGLSTQEGE